MGNTHGRESRGGPRPAGRGPFSDVAGQSQGQDGDRSRRASRPDLTVLGLPFGSSSSSRQQPDAPFERRETKQEREARKLEKERAARVKERARSMKEEHVDGGYLVTMGVYTTSEDYNKAVVRQLQIERKIAPFWRGLEDKIKSDWAEHQIIAAARGLEIPPADHVPEHLVPRQRPSDLNSLTVPMGSRTLSASSDQTGSNPGSSLPSPTSPSAPRISSPLKPPKKSLAAALNLSRNGSQADISPREVQLPHDPFFNGQPLEVFLYRETEECSLCFMEYPRFLNRTRCCQQLICSECFVQIKRPDPHHPEHHDDGENSSEANPEPPSEELIMEPAKCPYCTRPEFGVVYEPPPFRRGLAYSGNASSVGAMNTAMSSTSSLNSSLSPTTANAPSQVNRKRTQSVSANAPGVITTDRIRPDWANRLASARAHQRRRAAAADALHQAAFVMGNQESRTIFGRPSRFSRRIVAVPRGGDNTGSSANSGGNDGATDMAGPEPGPRSSSGRTGPSRERIDAAHLESLMMAEAIRLSLADEEERRKKAEKEAKKESKKREKDERKAAKKRGEVYSGSGSSASSLSLSLGRRRGNSAASNLRLEAGTSASTSSTPGHTTEANENNAGNERSSNDKGKAVDRGDSNASSTADGSSSLPIPSPCSGPRGASHLRQMSNASSISSSGADSVHDSGNGKRADMEDQPASARSDEGDSSGQEPMFNFRSLAEMVGVPIDGESEVPGGIRPGSDSQHDESEKADGEHVEHAGDSTADDTNEKRGDLPRLDTEDTKSHPDVKKEDSAPPHVIITPETPAPMGDDNDSTSKQLGHDSVEGTTSRSTQ
ncbi:hypothetical protein F5Y15DRAFT_339961 [Xylariaceae sp. FL0016]|nr:hypothetical protein F5Y15DRAFT_339961 [Xylariaceae sp. FL0016]